MSANVRSLRLHDIGVIAPVQVRLVGSPFRPAESRQHRSVRFFPLVRSRLAPAQHRSASGGLATVLDTRDFACWEAAVATTALQRRDILTMARRRPREPEGFMRFAEECGFWVGNKL